MVLLTVALGIAAPFFNADRYRDPIQASLTAALGRAVTIGDVRLDLFTGPGISVSNVIIADLPSGGAEPFAYVGELRAVPRLWSFWTGQLEFSSLTLVDAHVNLMRPDAPDGAAVWNFEPLLRPRLLAAFPRIRLRGARINFKIGDRKNMFYLLNTDLDVSPRAGDGSEWEISMDGEPARTDRPANGFGALSAKGQWAQKSGAPGRVEFDVKLDRSEIGDLIALVEGHDAGIQGIMSGQAHVAGPVSSLGVEGEMRVSELHGWDQSPASGGVFAFRVSGAGDADKQHLELFAIPRGERAAVKAHLVADQILQQPRWSFDAHLDALPVSSLPGLLRNFGASTPESLRLSGALEGDVHYDQSAGWRGKAEVRSVELLLRNVPPLRFEQASIELANGAARLEPVSMVSGSDTIGSVGGDYSLEDGSFDVELSSAGGPLGGLLKAFPVASVPLLSRMQSANWTGELKYVQPAAGPGRWTGAGEMSDAVVNLPALSVPLQIAGAHVAIDGDAIDMDRMDLRVGDVNARGEYRYVPGAAHPHQFRLALDAIDAGTLPDLFQPVLRRRANLIDMALSLGRAPAPDWLRAMRAEGTIQADSVRLGSVDLDRVRSRVIWDGAQISLPGWQSRWAAAVVGGRITLDARETTPRFGASLKLNGVEWQGGKLDGTLRLQTAGTGLDALANLRVDGKFTGRDLALEPLGMVEQLAGSGQMSWNGNAPRFRFSELRLVSGGEKWTGSGASQEDGEVALQLSSRGKQMNLAGSLTDPAKIWVER